MLGMIREIIEQGNQIKRIYSQITTERRRQEVYTDKCLLKTEYVRETLKGSREEEKELLKEILESLESIETAKILLHLQIQNRIQDLENLETEEEEEEEEKEIYPVEDPEAEGKGSRRE